jgi:hypothetical protein
LGKALHESVHMKLSVPLYGAEGDERAAILDHLDVPLANQDWLRVELDKLVGPHDADAAQEGITRLRTWEEPGPGSFYDDLGNPAKQPHLVRPLAWEDDPGYLHSPRTDFRGTLKNGRQSWNHYAETLLGTPILLHYDGLDPNATYFVRVTYSGRYRPTMTLTANDKYPVHGSVQTQEPPVQREYPVPREATAGGALTLKWECGAGRGAQVSEVWLLKR